MIDPRYWWRFFRVRRAIAHYPIYDAPHKQREETLPEEKIQENFKYFMAVRMERVAILQKWLRDHFKVNAMLDGNGILALEKWISDFGGGLINNRSDTMTIFSDYNPPWVGEYRGYNVIFDIAIFLGEYLISKRPILFWEINRPHLNEEGVLVGVYVGRPVLKGFQKNKMWSHNTFQNSYGFVRESRKRSKIGSIRSVYYMHTLSYKMKVTLHDAALPAGDYPFITGDYRDEPL